jgi:AraC-like DNA-binding protein
VNLPLTCSSALGRCDPPPHIGSSALRRRDPAPQGQARYRKNGQARTQQSRYGASMDTTLGRDRLREFINLILCSLDDDVDGSGIASRAYLSRYHFDRLVSAAIGESPGAFRRRLLLERAAWELRGSRASILRVALQSGYRSVEGFTRTDTHRDSGGTSRSVVCSTDRFSGSAPRGCSRASD